jgi:hypothetical protein
MKRVFKDDLNIYKDNQVFEGPLTNVNMYRDQVLNGPLGARAWTLQEEVLPRRTLYYTSKQLVWKCTHCLINEENFPHEQYQGLYPILEYDCPLTPEAIDRLWYEGVVEQYSERNLTFGSDRLVAISGLAKATYLNRHVDYIAGLWKDCLLSGTLWQRNSPGHKNKTYSCPSWSWASQNSTVSYRSALHRSGDVSMFRPRVVDVQWEPGAASHFGDVISACLYLDTEIILGIVTRDICFGTKQHDKDISQSLVFSTPGSMRLWHAAAILDDDSMLGGPVILALQTQSNVILLLDPPDLNADEYRRVGIAEINITQAGEGAKSNWKRKIIKLV